MSTTNRREVAKRLTREIAVTTDPETLIRLTTQLAKMLPKRAMGRPRKPAGEAKQNLPAPDGKEVLLRLVLQIESKIKARGGWSALARPEQEALLTEAKNSISAAERAALEAYGHNRENPRL